MSMCRANKSRSHNWAILVFSLFLNTIFFGYWLLTIRNDGRKRASYPNMFFNYPNKPWRSIAAYIYTPPTMAVINFAYDLDAGRRCCSFTSPISDPSTIAKISVGFTWEEVWKCKSLATSKSWRRINFIFPFYLIPIAVFSAGSNYINLGNMPFIPTIFSAPK